VNSLQDETENLKQSAEVSRCKAADQSEQLLAVMTTLKDEHSQVRQLLYSIAASAAAAVVAAADTAAEVGLSRSDIVLDGDPAPPGGGGGC